ncbi:DnaE-like DNA polymerase III (alpha) [Arthrobacter phage Racecar]|nr:DnaE-like DNA polymerase III [Arthrobacter phage Racecar]
MTDYFHGPLLGFDIESTGVDPFEDRIVTFSMVYSAYKGANPEILEWLIDPGVEIAEGASDVHGITTEYAQEFGKQAHNAMPYIARRMERIAELGIPFVIYNAPFDTTMLWQEFQRYNVPLKFTQEDLYSRVIDPLVIDKACDKWRKGSRKLTDTAKLYGYDLTNAHNSTADVEATIHITRQLDKHFKPEMTLEMLQEFQKDAKIEQSTSFQKYLRNKKDEEGNLVDPDAVISTEWPFQTKREND